MAKDKDKDKERVEREDQRKHRAHRIVGEDGNAEFRVATESLLWTQINTASLAIREHAVRIKEDSQLSTDDSKAIIKALVDHINVLLNEIRTRRDNVKAFDEATETPNSHIDMLLTTQPFMCFSCFTKSTPEWRRGPLGNKTLCNACGLQYAKNFKVLDQAST